MTFIVVIVELETKTPLNWNAKINIFGNKHEWNKCKNDQDVCYLKKKLK